MWGLRTRKNLFYTCLPRETQSFSFSSLFKNTGLVNEFDGKFK